jgi:glucose repression mediator protein
MENRDRERERPEHAIPPPPQIQSEEPERAARKMEVDEDYDDEGDEDKKGGIVSGPASAAGDAKATSPAGVNGHGVNGVANGQPKAEP